ncbi:MAG TPA: hypothetical protein VMX17_08215 [Candidatus Glassbacteria bacterium]|nr:hypothetical protein [Candidatus Glassbacteria bacterium]
MEIPKYIDFLKEHPKVVYELLDYKLGWIDQFWEWKWTGIFGKGYYQLTKNGRRHPKGNFKVTQQIYNEMVRKRCKIVEKNDTI